MNVYALIEYDFDDEHIINIYTDPAKAENDKEILSQTNADRGYSYHIVERTLIQCK